jgi:enoyl-CoA hydratase
MRTLLVAAMLALAFGSTAMAQFDKEMEGKRYLQWGNDGGVYVIRFFNPPTNLMNARMVAELRDTLTWMGKDDRVRVIIFTGAIDNYFIQHYDVGELSTTADAAATNASIGASGELHDTHKLLLEIEALPKPVIAAINGQAHGGGFEFALACDFRIMTNPGSVGLPEVNVGILPGAGGTVRLPRLIGEARAKELIMQGQVADAETAVNYGMVMKAVPPDQLMPEALKLAKRLESLPPQSLAQTKKVIHSSMEMPLRDALKLEEESFWILMRTEEAQRRMKAYVQSTKGSAAQP